MCLEYAIAHGARQIHLVGMTGYAGTDGGDYFGGYEPGHEPDTNPENIERRRRHTLEIIQPFTQAAVDCCPDIDFVFHGRLNYQVSGPNVRRIVPREELAECVLRSSGISRPGAAASSGWAPNMTLPPARLEYSAGEAWLLWFGSKNQNGGRPVSKLVLQTAATDRPVSTEMAAEWLRETDSDRYGVISELVDAAIATLEREHWTQFCTATYDQYFDSWPVRFMLRKHPVVTVSSVKYTNQAGVETTLATSVWEQADESGRGIVRLKHNQSWPSDCRGHEDDIVIRYSAGYGASVAVPAPVKLALRIWIADSYAFPESVSPLKLSTAPRTVDRLMAQYSYRTIG